MVATLLYYHLCKLHFPRHPIFQKRSVSKLGKNVILAGQAAVTGHLKVADNVVIGGRGGVTKSLSKPDQYWGLPVKPISKELREKAALKKLLLEKK